MYKLLDNTLDGKQYVILVEQNLQISMDETNTDYQAYLAWVALGNVAEPAENT